MPSGCCAAAATASPSARSPGCRTRAARSSRCSPASSGWTATGRPRIRFDIPDFQGQLRLMAVAFSAHKVGSGDGVDDGARPGRDDWCRCRAFSRPATPRGSGSSINNLEGAAGDYHLTLSASGAGAVRGAGRPHRPARSRRQFHRRLRPVGDDARQCGAEAGADRARRSEDRARFHDRRAAGASLSAAPLCRAAAAGARASRSTTAPPTSSCRAPRRRC